MRICKLRLLSLLLLTVILYQFTGIQPSSVANAETGTQRWAIVIGVSDYQFIDEDIPYPAGDAAEFAAALEPIFGKDHIYLLTDSNATKLMVQSLITNWLDQQEGSDDVVVIFFTGHGAEGGYMLAHDSKKTWMPSVINPFELDGWLDQLESEHVTVILESCGGQDTFSTLRQSGRVVMSCNNTGKTCWANKRDGGLFSHYITEALGSPEVVDVNSDNLISAEEVFNYTRPRVVANAPVGEVQTPAMDDSHTGELALFRAAVITFDSDPRIAGVTIDGQYYSEKELPISLKWAEGTPHTIETPGLVNRPEKDYPFSSWSDGSTSAVREIVVLESSTYVASYRKQYPLTILSEYGEVEGQRLYTENTTVSFSVSPSIIDHGDGSRHVFIGWSGDSDDVNPESSMLMDSPKTVSANWQLQYYLTVEVDPSGVITIAGDGWHDAGSVVSPGTIPSIIQANPGVRHVFDAWQVDGVATEEANISIIVDSPHIASARYETQHELIIESERGNPDGGGWHPAGAEVEISVESPQGFLIRDVFDGWSGTINASDPDTTILMDAPKTVTAEWGKDYSQLFILIGGIIVLVLAFAIGLIIRSRRSPKGYVG